MSSSLLDRLEDILWIRHSNPKSGWSRVPSGPVLVYAVYRRSWRLFLVTLLWTVINPFLFSPPETEEAWMTRGVLAERWWVRQEQNGTLGVTYPNICNVGSVLAFGYALLAAWRRRSAGTAVGSILAFGLKFWWIGVLVRRYDAQGRPNSE